MNMLIQMIYQPVGITVDGVDARKSLRFKVCPLDFFPFFFPIRTEIQFKYNVLYKKFMI